jgi:benzoyl-CoA reductase/2-hydroxyglutaryl-CoA dehydratase subunit BcrC/BadD/HgdB
MSDIKKKFYVMRLPFQTDDKKNIIDYNWHVDGIIKNSQSYNKEGKKPQQPEEEEEKVPV